MTSSPDSRPSGPRGFEERVEAGARARWISFGAWFGSWDEADPIRKATTRSEAREVLSGAGLRDLLERVEELERERDAVIEDLRRYPTTVWYGSQVADWLGQRLAASSPSALEDGPSRDFACKNCGLNEADYDRENPQLCKGGMTHWFVRVLPALEDTDREERDGA